MSGCGFEMMGLVPVLPTSSLSAWRPRRAFGKAICYPLYVKTPEGLMNAVDAASLLASGFFSPPSPWKLLSVLTGKAGAQKKTEQYFSPAQWIQSSNQLVPQ